MTPREVTRAEQLLTICAAYPWHVRTRREPEPSPAFFADGAELDWLETLDRHTPITLARRDALRRDRAAGRIADAGERWPWVAEQRSIAMAAE